jgi:nucleoside-diphosphate-sugar epimerase
VTGANGFVGQGLCRRLLQETARYRLVAAARIPSQMLSGGLQCIGVGDFDAQTSWLQATCGVDVVVHLAGRVHVMDETDADPLTTYRSVNTEGTLNLARQAASAGVRRLVFVSTIKVCGEGQLNADEAPYTERHSPAPADPYATSKWEAEQGLASVARETGLEVSILRPPLIYGPGVGANFLRLMQAVDRGWPLPLGGIRNCRDLIYLDNLVDAIVRCIVHPAAANRTFLVADGEGASTPELIRRIAIALERPPRLLPLPEKCLRLVGVLTGRRPAVERLLSSLLVDTGEIRRSLGWLPPQSLQGGLNETAKWYRSLYHG